MQPPFSDPRIVQIMDEVVLDQPFIMSERNGRSTRPQRRLANKLHETVSCKVPLYLFQRVCQANSTRQPWCSASSSTRKNRKSSASRTNNLKSRAEPSHHEVHGFGEQSQTASQNQPSNPSASVCEQLPLKISTDLPLASDKMIERGILRPNPALRPLTVQTGLTISNRFYPFR